MRSVAPRVAGLPEITLAEGQQEYMVLTAAQFNQPGMGGGLLTRWKPSAEELALLNAGEDVYVGLLTFGNPMQPIHVSVGAPAVEPPKEGGR